MMRHGLQRFGDALPALIALALTAWMIELTKDVGLLDTGDFRRSVQGILRHPVDHPNYAGWGPWMPRWVLESSFNWAERLTQLNTADLQFAGLATLQDLFGDEYNLRWAGALQKLLLGASLLWMCKAMRADLPRWLLVPMFAVALCGVLSWHHAGFFHSFYQEQALFLAFVLGLAAHFSGWRYRGALIVVATFWAANAKPQYFYLPSLVLMAYWLYARLAGLNRERSLVVALLLTQLLALVPLASNPARGVNYYHSLYFGSLLLSDRAHEARRPDCVGTDVWGWHYDVARGDVQSNGRRDCLAAVGVLTLADLLRPYWQSPMLAPRVVGVALTQHSTVNYFHVKRDVHFRITAADHGQAPTNEALQALSSLREAVVSPYLLPWLALGAVLPWMVRRDPRSLRYQIAIGLLSCFAASQLVVALLGEGFRDLSKHLAAAQFAVDLMLVLAAEWGICALARAWGRRNGATSPPDATRSEGAEEAPLAFARPTCR